MERRQVDGAPGRLSNLEIIRVCYYAHDFIRPGFADAGHGVESDPPSDGVAACKVVPGQRPTDDRYERARLVLETESAPGKKRRSERLKVPRRNMGYRNPAAILGPFLVTLDGGKAAGSSALKRSRRADGCRAYAGHGCQTIQQFPVCAGQSLVTVSAARRIECHQKNVVAAEAQIRMLEVRQIGDKQAGSTQQHHRQGHLRHYQALSKKTVEPRRASSPGIAQRRRRGRAMGVTSALPLLAPTSRVNLLPGIVTCLVVLLPGQATAVQLLPLASKNDPAKIPGFVSVNSA